MRPGWNEYFMVLAKIISTRSTCNSRPTGCVIVRDKQVLATGYNGSMPGAPHCIDDVTVDGKPFCYRRAQNAPEGDKYNFCRASHAEANAVARAAQHGISIKGSTAFITLAPCYVCLKLLATAGIEHIYYEFDYESTNKGRDEHWKNAIKDSPIESIDRLTVSDESIRTMTRALRYPTSERRLTETYDYIGLVRDRLAVAEVYGALSHYRRALVEGLMAGESETGYIAPDFGLELPQLTSMDRVRAVAAEALLDDTFGSDPTALIVTAGGASSPDGECKVKSEKAGGSLLLEFVFKNTDLVDGFYRLLDMATVAMNRALEYESGLKRGLLKVSFSGPYVPSDKRDEAIKILA